MPTARDPAHTSEETIAAIATPPGAGGIGIIRISGPLSRSILSRLFTPRKPLSSFASHRMYYGWMTEPESAQLLDEVLAVFMEAPNTYTREDVVEIHCHGSYLILEQILRQVFHSGARPAQPGEFTKRAFLNGRIDLTRAEAVVDLLSARTGPALDLAFGQLQGHLHQQVMDIREALLGVRAVIEVAIDFPEDEVEILDSAILGNRLIAVESALQRLLAAADHGKIFREGISAVILGRPNVGKSSLLNTLLREERALVTPVPGTTRDTIEEYVDIKGIPVRLIDTAGIRETTEAVEELGIQRARAKSAEADLILFLVDGSVPLQEEDRTLYASINATDCQGSMLVVINKTDLVPGFDLTHFSGDFPGQTLVPISARNHDGIDALRDAVFAAVVSRGEGGLNPGDVGCAPNVRHRAALDAALVGCVRARKGLEGSQPPDLVAVDLQAALGSLADIVGETTTEDMLDMIFERFCIGK